MTGLVFAVAAGLVVAGLLGTIGALTGTDAEPRRPARSPNLVARFRSISPRTRVVALASVAVGALLAVASGWLVALVVVPAAALGLPALLAAGPESRRIARLEAMAEWTRNLAGVLTVGVGLEQALVATLRSTPEPIRPEVSGLVARLRARWSTEEALRAFADDLDDATGDLVASYLILGARRRGSGLASVLQGLAESVAEEVTARRKIEADRAKPRANARNVTVISAGVLGFLAFNGEFLAPYRTPTGQIILAVLLAAYAGCLVWLRRMSQGQPLPRFMGTALRKGARP